MPRVYLCDYCHKEIDEDKEKFVIHKEGTVYERRFHAGDKECLEAYQKMHGDEFSAN